MKNPNFRWYLTAAAVKQYLVIAGLPDDDGGPAWGQAEQELSVHIATAREAGHNDNSLIYRTSGRVLCGRRPRAKRLEFYVRHNPREEGSLPQLIAIRDKDGRQRYSP